MNKSLLVLLLWIGLITAIIGGLVYNNASIRDSLSSLEEKQASSDELNALKNDIAMVEDDLEEQKMFLRLEREKMEAIAAWEAEVASVKKENAAKEDVCEHTPIPAHPFDEAQGEEAPIDPAFAGTLFPLLFTDVACGRQATDDLFEEGVQFMFAEAPDRTYRIALEKAGFFCADNTGEPDECMEWHLTDSIPIEDLLPLNQFTDPVAERI